jgi:glycosyltransferase involved in cell wall biosynthesis
MKKVLKTVFPPGSLGFKLLKRIAIALRLTPALPLHELQYSDWTDRVEPLTWTPYKKLTHEPLISIVVPVFNPPAVHFLSMVYSVVNQTYPNWQLVLVNASSNKKARELTRDAKHIDDRITVANLQTNLGIAENTNAGIKKAKGVYVALLDHDDLLAPQALYEVVLLLQEERKPQLIYSDEDKVTNNGEYRLDPHFKSDWSPQLLKELNYINHMAVIEKNLLDSAGAYKAGFDGAQDYDLFLRLVDTTERIAHVPKVLYHWRTARTSTAENFSQKDNVLDAGVRALEDHLKRSEQQGKVKPVPKQPGFYKIDYEVRVGAKVSILILPSKLEAEYRKFLFNFLDSIKKTRLEVEIFAQSIQVPIKNIPPNVTLRHINSSDRVTFIKEATKIADSDYCLILGSAILLHNKSWLRSLIGLISQVKSIAIAAPLIMAGDRKTIVDAGYVKGADAVYMPLFQGYPDDQHTAFGNSNWVRNVDAVGSRCLVIRTELLKANLDYLQPEGSRLLFSANFFDRLMKDGQQVVVWPFSRVVYGGDMTLPNKSSGYFNEHLCVSKTEFTLPEVLQVARSYKDE